MYSIVASNSVLSTNPYLWARVRADSSQKSLLIFFFSELRADLPSGFSLHFMKVDYFVNNYTHQPEITRTEKYNFKKPKVEVLSSPSAVGIIAILLQVQISENELEYQDQNATKVQGNAFLCQSQLWVNVEGNVRKCFWCQIKAGSNNEITNSMYSTWDINGTKCGFLNRLLAYGVHKGLSLLSLCP